MAKKKGKKDDEKKAALQARKEAKAEKAARKKLAKLQGNDLEAAIEDEELDKVLQAYKSQNKEVVVDKATIQDLDTPFPLARANATLESCIEGKKDYFFLFGGEYYDGIENIVLDELLRLDVAKMEWKKVVTSPRPPQRCAHSCISYKQNLYVFGGELGACILEESRYCATISCSYVMLSSQYASDCDRIPSLSGSLEVRCELTDMDRD
eukprot:scaffold1169_cov120-Cylindrotheca_fusiformis.AAC.21